LFSASSLFHSVTGHSDCRFVSTTGPAPGILYSIIYILYTIHDIPAPKEGETALAFMNDDDDDDFSTPTRRLYESHEPNYVLQAQRKSLMKHEYHAQGDICCCIRTIRLAPNMMTLQASRSFSQPLLLLVLQAYAYLSLSAYKHPTVPIDPK